MINLINNLSKLADFEEKLLTMRNVLFRLRAYVFEKILI